MRYLLVTVIFLAMAGMIAVKDYQYEQQTKLLKAAIANTDQAVGLLKLLDSKCRRESTNYEKAIPYSKSKSMTTAKVLPPRAPDKYLPPVVDLQKASFVKYIGKLPAYKLAKN